MAVGLGADVIKWLSDNFDDSKPIEVLTPDLRVLNVCRAMIVDGRLVLQCQLPEGKKDAEQRTTTIGGGGGPGRT